jgi:hypothetical protein
MSGGMRTPIGVRAEGIWEARRPAKPKRWKREGSPKGLSESPLPHHNYSLKCKVESSKNSFALSFGLFTLGCGKDLLNSRGVAQSG